MASVWYPCSRTWQWPSGWKDERPAKWIIEDRWHQSLDRQEFKEPVVRVQLCSCRSVGDGPAAWEIS